MSETTTGRPSGTNEAAEGRYASVNGLDMYYEVHGTGSPLVLLHGGLSGIGTSFGRLLPSLAETRQVIAVELQAHGRTADIDRPLTMEQMAEDTIALLDQLSIENADFFGYSVGAGVALRIVIRHPQRVGKLVLASVTYDNAGLHPGLLENMAKLQPEHLAGSPFEEEYRTIAPRPEDWPTLIQKVKDLDASTSDLPAETIRSIRAPALIVIGDSDIIRPEHAVELFRLLGGGVMGDLVGLPASQLAVLPGTTHISIVERANLLLPMITAFLDDPTPERAQSDR